MQRLQLSSRASRLRLATVPRRTLWQCATYTSPSPVSLLERVEQKIAEAPSDVTLYALSKNVPQQLVDDFRRALSPSGSKGTTIGCLSEVLPANSSSSSAESELFSIAIAQHRPAQDTERAITLRSTLLGRPNIALGREIKPEYQADHDQVDSGLEAFLKGGSWGFGEQTQEQKSSQHEIEELKGEDPSSVRELVVFTADRIQPFLAALSRFTSASTVGMVGSSTPFHTRDGSAYSLFYGDEKVATGAVGVAVVDSAASASSTPLKLHYGSLAPVGDAHEVTTSQGNIVLALSGQNAARLLLNAVNDLFGTSAANLPAAQRTHEKEKEFYAAVYASKPEFPLDLSKAQLVAKIMAGDPLRGAMSVETEEEVRKGSYIVFLHQPDVDAAGKAKPAENQQLAFLSVPSSDVMPHIAPSECPSKGGVSAEEYFLAASENGVVIAPGQINGRRPPPRVCAIEGTVTALQ